MMDVADREKKSTKNDAKEENQADEERSKEDREIVGEKMMILLNNNEVAIENIMEKCSVPSKLKTKDTLKSFQVI